MKKMVFIITFICICDPIESSQAWYNVPIEYVKAWHAKAKESRRQKRGLQLLYTSNEGDIEQVKRLVRKGANLNRRGIHGFTALMHAANHGHRRIVEYLIESGAQVNKKNWHGFTALIYAANHGHRRIVEYLIENGAEGLYKALRYARDKEIEEVIRKRLKERAQEIADVLESEEIEKSVGHRVLPEIAEVIASYFLEGE